MQQQHQPDFSPAAMLRELTDNRERWIKPVVICTLLAVAYAVVMPRFWEATQALVVRPEAAANATRPGRFADLYEMRTLQETILEVARSRQVVAATLQAVSGEPADDEAVETFRERLRMLPPGGAEFGKTEVFYFAVKDHRRERAIELVTELCEQLDLRLRELRDERAQSVIAELHEQVELAATTHASVTEHLSVYEAEVGADLGELRILHSAIGGQSDLRQQAVSLEAELRSQRSTIGDAEQLLLVLRLAQQDPAKLVAMPTSLLTSQPTLRRLKDGLVDAQLRAARLQGNRTAEHPNVQAAFDSVVQIRSDLHNELQVAIDGLLVELQLGHDRLERLERRRNELNTRLASLAEHRAEYSNRVSSVENSRQLLADARQKLSDARATQVSARMASLVTQIDAAETGPYPIGPGRSLVVTLGMFGGLALGVGLVYLGATSPLPIAKSIDPPALTPVGEVSSTSPANANKSARKSVAIFTQLSNQQ